MTYLLDTCTVSDLFKKDPTTLGHFKRIMPSELSISSITIMEIEYGLKLNTAREEKIRPVWQAFLKEIQVFSFDEEEALCTAFLRAHLKKHMIGAYDCMIAGTALAHDLCVITSNMREFARLTDFIKIENWRTL